MSFLLLQLLNLLLGELNQIVGVGPVLGRACVERTRDKRQHLGVKGRLVKGLPDSNEVISEPCPVGWREVQPIPRRETAVDLAEVLEVLLKFELVLVELILVGEEGLIVGRRLDELRGTLRERCRVGENK